MTTLTDTRRTLRPRDGALIWLRQNLFRSRLDALLTLVLGAIGLYLMFRFVQFVFVNARWEIIQVNLKLLLVGRWPVVHLLRIAVSVIALAFWGGVFVGLIRARQVRRGTADLDLVGWRRIGDLGRRFGLLIATVLLLLAPTTTAGPRMVAIGLFAAVLLGRVAGSRLGSVPLPTALVRLSTLGLVITPFVVFLYLVDAVPFAKWEGFLFNLTAAGAGIILCFPLGVLLALGRRSKLPLLRSLSVAYIELVRGAPLYVLLLMANVSLEFFVPPWIAPSKPLRAVVTFTLFTAAYVAEIVRGGLQSVPYGQEEAAKALGLSPYRQMTRIVLPQALRNVIPAQIGQFISLFKDTTLAGLALGILDLLAAGQAITQQEAYRGQGLIIESLLFVAFLFWVGSFTMSRESQRLERKLGVGVR
ncbi:MAG TPA: amino acid ABC transporter permease [Acidimicrobiia bacterium]|nr:amino acid ABC transporter permease [Acidimicrobiia bacterium]